MANIIFEFKMELMKWIFCKLHVFRKLFVDNQQTVDAGSADHVEVPIEPVIQVVPRRSSAPIPIPKLRKNGCEWFEYEVVSDRRRSNEQDDMHPRYRSAMHYDIHRRI